MRLVRFTLYTLVIIISLMSAGCVANKTQMAIYSLLREVSRSPDNPDLHAKLAVANLTRYGETGNRSYVYVAEHELKEVIRLRPESHWGHCTLARVYQMEKKPDLALFEAKEAVRLDPGCATSHSTLGSLYGEKGYSEETCYNDEMNDLAVAEFKEAVRLNPESAYVHSWLGTLYSRKGLYDLSVFEQKEALRLYDSAENHRRLGHAYFELGDRDRALSEYEEAFRRNPKIVGIYLDRAYVYFFAGRYENTLACLTSYLNSTRHSLAPDLVLLQYIAMTKLGENDRALKTIQDHAASFAEEKGVYAVLLQYYLGKSDEAGVLSKARHNCDRARAYYFIGYDFLLKGDQEKAADCFNKTLQTNTCGLGFDTGARAMLETLGGTSASPTPGAPLPQEKGASKALPAGSSKNE